MRNSEHINRTAFGGDLEAEKADFSHAKFNNQWSTKYKAENNWRRGFDKKPWKSFKFFSCNFSQVEANNKF